MAPDRPQSFVLRWTFTAAAAYLLTVLLLVLAAIPLTASAKMRAMDLHVGQGRLIKLTQNADSIFVANPEVADIQVSGPRSVLVFGVRTGRTTLYALGVNGDILVARDVHVSHNLAMLKDVLDNRFPDHNVSLTSAPKTLMATGSVATPQEAQAIVATLQGIVGKEETVIDRLSVTSPTQVNIRVRIAEVSRNVDQRLGFNWQALLSADDFVFGVATGRDFLVPAATAGSTIGETILLPVDEFGSYLGRYRNGRLSLDALIDALNEEGLARTLAEPNLTAVSGQLASFIAGGEFPIPISQDGDRTSIEFKPFGVVLDFTPTVLSSDRISLTVRPEVSDLSQNGAIEISGFRIPALTVRRVETTVELGSGQSLVLAGLLQKGTRDIVQKLPGLGDIPVLGTLFTSTSYQNNETELVVIVTPYVVRPTRPDALETPLGRYAPNRPLERYLLQRTAAAETVAGPQVGTPEVVGPQGPLGPQAPDLVNRRQRGRLQGPVGFIY